MTHIPSGAQDATPAFDSVIRRLGTAFVSDTATADLSIAIRLENNTWFYNFGKDMPTESSVYEIGSLTKTFASLVLAHAVAEGRVSFDDDVRKYLQGDFPNLNYKGEPVRLIHLANTSSALPDTQFPRPDTGLTREAFLVALSSVRPDTLPGSRPRHSNAAATLLSLALERIYGEPIDRLITRYILDPLQMKNTSFGSSPRPAQMMNGFDAAGRPAPFLTNPLSAGTGSMRSGTSDMIKYLAFLSAQPNPAAVLALKPTITVDAVTNKVRDPRSIALVNDRVYAISLNWMQYHPAKDDLRIWSDGGTFGFRSYAVMYPEKALSIVMLSNRTGPVLLDKMYNIGATISGLVVPRH